MVVTGGGDLVVEAPGVERVEISDAGDGVCV